MAEEGMIASALFIFGFDGTTAPHWVLDRLRRDALGGVILFARNFEVPLSPMQAADLCESFDIGSGPPPIVSIDQEGGRVQRLKAPFTVFPPMARLAGRDPTQAEQVGRALGTELRYVGVNVNYAPVLDVHTNPLNPIIGDRALGTTADEVATRALAFLRGMEAAGVRGCGKHFPGHGDTAQDSHLTLPRVDADRERLFAIEVAPFAAAVRAGIGMLMTAHVVYPAVDSRPATLSSRWLGQVLRQELGFDGVILSDDLDMQAVAGADVGEVVVESLLAGCDAFLLCRDPSRQARAEEALQKAAEKDPLVQKRLEESAARVLKFRQTLNRPRPDRAALAALPDPTHQALAAALL